MKKLLNKKIIALLLVLPLCLAFATACKKKQTPQGPITLSQTEISIEIGQAYTLEADADNVTWTVSDSSVARVDVRGRVVGVSVGETVVTATKNGVDATCSVTVVDKQEKEPSYSVKIASQKLQIKAGDTAKLNATLFANGEIASGSISYSSLNESVATVDENGVVTAVSVGSASITAGYGKAKATCEVSVYADGAALSLSSNSIEIRLGQTVALEAFTLGDGDVAWDTSNDKISVSKGGEITGLALGESVVTASFGGREERCRVTVYDLQPIRSALDFAAMKNDKYIRYVLAGDIDFSDYEWTPNNIVSEFSSRLDGNGYKIQGLRYTLGGRWAGIFGTLTQSAVIENVLFYIDAFSYESDCGILAINNHGTVRNCYFYTRQVGSNNDVAVRLRSGLIRNNFGTISGVIVEPHNLSGGNISTSRIHAVAGLNVGNISSVIVVSAATTTHAITTNGVTEYFLMHQMISGAETGYPNNYYPDNSFDKRRTNSVIFTSVENLFARDGIDGHAALTPTTQNDHTAALAALKVDGQKVMETFDTVWNFGNNLVTLCGTTVYPRG